MTSPRRTSPHPLWTPAGGACLLLCCISGMPTISPEGSAARDSIAPQLSILGGISALVLGRSLVATVRNHGLAPAALYLLLALLAPFLAHGSVVLWHEIGARLYPGSFVLENGVPVHGSLPPYGRAVLGALLFASLALVLTPVALVLRHLTRDDRG